MKLGTKEAALEAYKEKLAADIAEMSDEEVQEKLAELEEGESLQKLAADSEALGRFVHIGHEAGIKDWPAFMKEAGDDKDAAIALYEAELVKEADEISEAESAADELVASEEAGEEPASPQDVALEAAMEADPEAMKTAALAVLKDKNIAVYETDADGKPVRELQLS